MPQSLEQAHAPGDFEWLKIERDAAWARIDASRDLDSGYVPMGIIDKLLSEGGISAVVANDAISFGYVDPEVLRRAEKDEGD